MWRIALLILAIIFLALIPTEEDKLVVIVDDSEEDLDEIEEWAIIEDEDEE